MSLWRHLFYDPEKEERKKTIKLYDSAEALYTASNLPKYQDNLVDISTGLTKDLFNEIHQPISCALFEEMNALIIKILLESNLYYFVPSGARESYTDGVEHAAKLREVLRLKKSLYRDAENNDNVARTVACLVVEEIIGGLPVQAFAQTQQTIGQTFNIPLLDFLDDPHDLIFGLISCFHISMLDGTRLFEKIKQQFADNADIASGNIKPKDNKPLLIPIDLKKKHTIEEISEIFLRGTFLLDALQLKIPFTIPFESRFEHAHIVGGSGHGKTQCLQHIIYSDVIRASKNEGGFCVIDSQGDLINNIIHLAEFSPEHKNSLSDKLLLLDPNDIAHPLALNMFDMNLERLKKFSLVDQEKILNGTVELYEYIFSSLLGAELTQRQGVIFKYLARAMMAIPNATIQTLREFIEDGEPFKKYISSCGAMTEHFFITQFFTNTYNDTRRQILTRLWGILSNPVFERMFSAPKNKVDMFGAMNEGKIVLINTAKDLLKTEGCSIFGRFFIAMIAQAALSRSAIAERDRIPFFVFIDEAHDYFDDKIEDLLNQARKYRVGLTLAHQNLDQLDVKLRASIIASTSIKMVGGLSAKDANLFAKNMSTNEARLLSVKKRDKHTEFACYIRNLTPQPINLTVPFGVMESQPRTSKKEFNNLIKINRKNVSVTKTDKKTSSKTETKSTKIEPEIVHKHEQKTNQQKIAEKRHKKIDQIDIYSDDDEPPEKTSKSVIKKRIPWSDPTCP